MTWVAGLAFVLAWFVVPPLLGLFVGYSVVRLARRRRERRERRRGFDVALRNG